MLGDDPQERLAVVLVLDERAAVVARDRGRLLVRLAVHDRGQRGGVVATLVRVVGQAAAHEQRAEVGVAQAERPELVAVLLDPGRRVGRVVDEDLLGRDRDLGREAIGLDVELAVGADELHEVQAGQVARGVVEEHVLGARVGRVDPVRVGRGVPLVDRRVVLDARVAAQVGGIGHAPEDVAGAIGVHRLVRGDDGVGRPLAVVDDGLHERVGHADRVVGVLEEDRAVGLAGEARVVAGLDERPGLLLLVRLRVDELEDVRMPGVEDDHLGRAAGLAARLDDAGEGVIALHEGDGARGGAAAGHLLLGRADGARGWCPRPSRT